MENKTQSHLPDEPWISTKEACAYALESYGYVITPKTLNNQACVGGGPKFQKVGHERKYTKTWIDEYIASIASPPVTSTAQLKAHRQAAT